MRSRARLIEVLESVNGNSMRTTRTYCLLIAEAMRGTTKIGRGNAMKFCRVLIDGNSPHIRELATEALFYLNEDANG